MNRHDRAKAPVTAGDRHGETHRSFEILADVGADAVGANPFQRLFKHVDVGDRALGIALQRSVAERATQLGGRHLRKEQFSAGRAVQRDARARIHVEAHGRRRFDAIEIDDVVAVEHREIARLADLFDEAHENRVPPRARGRVHLHLERDARKARADEVALVERLAGHDAAANEQREYPVCGRLGQAAQLRDFFERQRILRLGDQLDDRKGAKRR